MNNAIARAVDYMESRIKRLDSQMNIDLDFASRAKIYIPSEEDVYSKEANRCMCEIKEIISIVDGLRSVET